MGGEVLERFEALPGRLQVEDVRVEAAHRLLERDVPDRPRARSREVTREVPLGRPLADPAERDQAPLDLLVGLAGELGEVDRLLRETEDVLRLAPGETEREQVVLARAAKPTRRRERVGLADAAAEALD